MSQRHRTVPCLISQLIREDNAYANKSCTWTYDGNGNILNKKTYAYTTGTLGTATATETNTYSTGSFKDQMISHAGHTISYDALGNPLNWYNNTATFSNITWEGRKLTGMTVGSTVYTFSYNSDGIRTKKQNGSNVVEYLYDDGGNLVEEKHSNYSLYFIYDDSNELIGFKVSSGGTYYYGKDVFGVIKYIYNASGTIVGTYTYDAWGQTISYSTTINETNLNPIRYKDYYYDTESGFYYLQSRYYDPQVGRFISADDTGYLGATESVLSFNLYTYCENEPLKNEDPSGNGIIKAIGIQISVSIMNFVVGLEFLWNTSNWKFEMFMFAGANGRNYISSSVQALKEDLLYSLKRIPKLSVKTIGTLEKFGLSVSFICVLGNRFSSFPRDYSGWFTGISFSYRHFTISGAVGRSGRSVMGSIGVGVTTNLLSIGMSKTYYWHLTSDFKFSSLLDPLKKSVNNAISWLQLFTFVVL